MNIQQILNEGRGVVLNDVEVIKDYGVKGGQTPHRGVHIKDDAGGATMLKLWGPLSNNQFQPGERFTVQAVGDGELTSSEWNGKWSINCNGCEIIRGGGGGNAQPQNQGGGSQPQGGGGSAPQGGGGTTPQNDPPPAQNANTGQGGGYDQGGQNGMALSADGLADAQAAHFARILTRIQGACADMGADPNAAVMAAATMTGSADGWWFGAKWPGMSGMRAKAD